MTERIGVTMSRKGKKARKLEIDFKRRIRQAKAAKVYKKAAKAEKRIKKDVKRSLEGTGIKKITQYDNETVTILKMLARHHNSHHKENLSWEAMVTTKAGKAVIAQGKKLSVEERLKPVLSFYNTDLARQNVNELEHKLPKTMSDLMYKLEQMKVPKKLRDKKPKDPLKKKKRIDPLKRARKKAERKARSKRWVWLNNNIENSVSA